MATAVEPPRAEQADPKWEAAQVLGSIIVGVFVAVTTGQPWQTPSFWGILLLAGAVTYLVLFWIRHQWLVPRTRHEVVAADQARLTSAITSSRRSAYAISSNWLSLWRTSTFRYYLHLDAAMSLTSYSSNRVSPLGRLSTDPAAQNDFFDYGWDLVRDIGNGSLPLRTHRLRLLIYPQWVYDQYTNEVLHLIRSHSAARIPCIPLVSEKLYDGLEVAERTQTNQLVEALGQTPADKSPPLSRLHEMRLARQTKKGVKQAPSFPDMLMIDAPFALDTSGVWWYSASGHVNHWDADHANEQQQALSVFEAICRHAHAAVWENYAAHMLGGVVVAATPGRLESEAFFARPYYTDWLQWIGENADTHNEAKELDRWLKAETGAMLNALRRYIEGREDSVESMQVLDVGCGFGRHLVDLLKQHNRWKGTGVDINPPMVGEAIDLAKEEGVHYRANFMVGDAAKLASCEEAEFDYAICMTNTLGNLPKRKQAELIRRLRKILRPGGGLFISTYSDSATRARMTSYEAVDLDIEVQGDRIIAAEGLESEAFSQHTLRGLIEENGLKLTQAVEDVAGIGLVAVAERPGWRES